MENRKYEIIFLCTERLNWRYGQIVHERFPTMKSNLFVFKILLDQHSNRISLLLRESLIQYSEWIIRKRFQQYTQRKNQSIFFFWISYWVNEIISHVFKRLNHFKPINNSFANEWVPVITFIARNVWENFMQFKWTAK